MSPLWRDLRRGTAGRAVAIAGRFAQPPRRVPEGVALHLVHGDEGRVMPVGLAVEAESSLRALGAVATLDRLAGLGHGIDERAFEAIVRRLGPAPMENAS